MEIKTKVRWHCIYTRMAKIKSITISSVGAGGNPNEAISLENSLAVSYGVKYKVTM